MSCNDNYQITFNNTGEFSPESAKALAKDLAGLAALSVLRRGVADPVSAAIEKFPDAFRSYEFARFMTLEEIAGDLSEHRKAAQALLGAIPRRVWAKSVGIKAAVEAIAAAWEEKEETIRGFIKRVGKDQDTIRALEVENTDLRRQLVNALERNRAAECSAKFAEMKALGITPEFPGKQTSKLEGARDDWAPESREVAMAEQWGEEFERQ